MEFLNNFHLSWKPIIALFHTDKFRNYHKQLVESGSITINFNELFDIFQMPVYKIQTVILGKSPHYIGGSNGGYAYSSSPLSRYMRPELKVIRECLILEYAQQRKVNYEDCLFLTDKQEWSTLEHWVNQGVFLLNIAPILDGNDEEVHRRIWDPIIKRIIVHIAKENPTIWNVWGDEFDQYKTYIINSLSTRGYDNNDIASIPADTTKNYIVEAPYPEGRNENAFYNFNPFFTTNVILSKTKYNSIKW